MQIIDAMNRRNGIQVTPVAHSHDYEVRGGDGGVLAKVSAGSFKKMLSRGHATDFGSMRWSTETATAGEVRDVSGGQLVIRADFTVKDGVVWLVPESRTDSTDILLFECRLDLPDYLEMTPVNGAQLLSKVENCSNVPWRDQYWLVQMARGSSLTFSRERQAEHDPNWPVNERSISFDQFGYTIHY